MIVATLLDVDANAAKLVVLAKERNELLREQIGLLREIRDHLQEPEATVITLEAGPVREQSE